MIGLVVALFYGLGYILHPVLGPPDNTLYQFKGQVELASPVPTPPRYQECFQLNYGIDGNYHCTTVEVHPNLTKEACDVQANYSNTLPGLGYRGQATCTPES
jgi:hypothetical protein